MNLKVLNTVLACLLLAGAMSLSCSRGESRDAMHEMLAYDLISHFREASIEDSDFSDKYRDLLPYPKMYRDPFAYDSPRIIKIGFEIDREKMFQNLRRSVYFGARQGSPCKISLPVKIEGMKSFISFSLAGLYLNAGISRGFEMSVITGSERYIVFSTVKNNYSIPEQRWSEFIFSLPDDCGKDFRLEINFWSNSRNPEHVFLANPRIFQKRDGGESVPNVVFVSVDALRADAVNSITDRYRLTPNMDSIAGEGVNCLNHFTVSNWTRPSTISMLASAYASGTGVNIFYPPVSNGEKEFFYHRSGVRPITSILKEMGYITRSIGNNAFIIDYTGIGVDLDFDELSEYETQWEDTMDITAETVSWLEQNRNRRFFLFINYNAPHNGYIPPEKYLSPLRERLKGIHPWFRAYLGEVAYTDDYLGRVIDALKRLSLYHNTIIVVTSDHGEIFSASHEMSPYTDVKSVFTHGQTQLDEELRVPLIIKPQKSSGLRNVKINNQVRSIDIAPTLLDLMNIKIPAQYQGKSILPIVEGKEKEERILYSEGRLMYSVRAGGYKYAERFYGFGVRPFHWGGDTVKEFSELYDLATDPGEEKNIINTNNDKKKQMQDLMKKMRFKQPRNFLMARGLEARGTICLQDGFFYDIYSDGKSSRIEKISRKKYKFILAPDESLVFETIPSNAYISLSSNNGMPLLYGRYMLPLTERLTNGVYKINSEEKSANGKPIDEIVALVPRGIFYWNETGNTGVLAVKDEKYLSKDINQLLQRWGYIQGKEKKENKKN